MKNTEATKKIPISFDKGANTDVDNHVNAQGVYYDAMNMVNRSTDGYSGSLQELGGEEVMFGTEDVTYKCICSLACAKHIVEIFCSISGTTINTPVRFRIDGEIMVETDKLNFDIDHPIQYDVDDSCQGGEFYITDFKNPPYIFVIEDIISEYNAGNQTYFADFNVLQYTVSLKLTPHHPIFNTLIETNGLSVGEYSYAIRYADSSGNRTNWSVQTPLIPVPAGQDDGSCPQWGGLKTYGRESNTATNSPYGIKINFRVENIANYEYIEIRRSKFVNGSQLNALPVVEFKKFIFDYDQQQNIDIRVTPNFVAAFLDDYNNNDWELLTDIEETQTIRGSFIAKAVRYYQNRLVFANIKYPSIDIEIPNTVDFIDDNGLAFPVVEKITTSTDKAGFGSVYNQVYNKSLMRGEKYGWGVYLVDQYGARSFVKPYDNGTNWACDWINGNTQNLRDFQMPNRRDVLNGKSKEYSVDNWKGAVTCSDVNSNARSSVGLTYEVFDLTEAVGKDDSCSFKNILSEVNDSYYKSLTDTGANSGGVNWSGCPDVAYPENLCNQIGYSPLRPTGDANTDVSGHDYNINTQVLYPDPITTEYVEKRYNPKGFGDNIYSLGLAFNGVTDIPEWARAFSIVRTKPANRVVANGIGYWDKRNGIPSNTILFYSPDINTDIGIGITTQTIIDNSASYQIQLVSPVGYFSEVYDFDAQKPYNADIISYAKILYEGGIENPAHEINPTHSQSEIGWGDGFVSYSRWYKDVPIAPIWNNNNGNHIFELSNSIVLSVSGRTDCLSISLDSDLYYEEGVSYFDSITGLPLNQKLPFYYINIIQKNSATQTGNQLEYIETGHLQKLRSNISVGNNAPQLLYLIDERWEDCVPNPMVNGALDITNSLVYDQNRYVEVGGKKWINVTYKDNVFLTNIYASFANNQPYTFLDNGVSTTVYGAYRHFGNPGVDRWIALDFNNHNSGVDISYFVPKSGDDITVVYDTRVPIKLFAGDCVIGESIFPVYDNVNGEGVNYTATVYDGYTINPRYYICNSTTNIFNRIQNENKFLPISTGLYGAVRQMLLSFIPETRLNYRMLYDSKYPNIHYIMRPHNWKTGDENDPTTFCANNNISINYHYDYLLGNTFEWENWAYGGFRFYGSANLDYSKNLNDRSNFSKPVIGFKEKTDFCTEVIWSEARFINEQDDPNLRNFPTLNRKDIADRNGEIKFLYDNDSNKGNNIFAFTNTGICLLLTDKTLLSDVNANNIAALQTEAGFIQGEYWLSKTIGCNDELWRSKAEFNNQVFFANNKGLFSMFGTDIKDISTGYKVSLLPLITSMGSGYTNNMCAVYNQKTNEYYICFDITEKGGKRTSITKIFNNDSGFWNGGSTYLYDKMVFINQSFDGSESKMYGTRDYVMYELNKGNTLFNKTMERFVQFHICPQINQTLEFVDLTTSSSIKPTLIEYGTNQNNVLCSTNGSVIRDYTNNWYNMIPRKSFGNMDRLQNDVFFVKINYDDVGYFVLSGCELGFKIIKD